MSLFIARRPVFDSHEKIFAYDLAVRGPAGPSGIHEEVQTEQLLAEIFLESGLDTVADGQGVMLTVGRDMLLSGTLPSLPADRVILQIPSAAGCDADLSAACKDLKSVGYRLAVELDDAEAEAPLDLAHLVKVDVTSVPVELLPDLVQRLGGHKARLLATNVRHRGERDQCEALGFELFEGYRFSAPESFARRDIGIEHLATFRVLKLVRDPKATDQEIEELLQGDVGLSYKLLRMVNSASTGGRDIWSIGHALRLLGREQVARWLSVLLVTDGGGKGVRAELMHLALLRARMCERFADLAGLKQTRGSLFLIGMLSVFDQLLEMPMPTLCDAMDLAPDLRGALVQRADFFGAVLRFVEAYVSGDWAEVELLAETLDVKPAELQPVYLEAMAWATSNRRTGQSD
jgi:Predicted signal transduction protein containing EAL and modified HD-GYP domains